MLSATRTAAPIHHDRRRTPNRANGARLGFRRTNGAANREDPTTARAIAAIDQITGLPVQIFSSVVGLTRQKSTSGQVSGRGRRAATTAATTPSGRAHQTTAWTASS